MNSNRRKAVGVLSLAAVAGLGAAVWKPRAKLADTRPPIKLDTLFPTRFGDWSADLNVPVQLVSPDQQAVLDKIYNQTLSRVYVDSTGQRVMLSVAYGGDQSDGTRAHRPEVCYPAQGFQIMQSGTGDLALQSGKVLPVRQLIAKQGARIEPITYWITVGDRTTLSGTEQKLAQLRYSTRGLIPDGMLVRASTIDNNSTRAFAVHRQFMLALSAAMPVESRPWVFGG